MDYDPSGTYAPVASLEAIRIFFAYASSQKLIVEGGVVSNAYLYEKIDYPVYIKQPTNLNGKEEMPGYFCRLLKPMYGIKQTARIQGSLVIETFVSYGFEESVTEERVLFLNSEMSLVVTCTVVDGLELTSEALSLLKAFKQRLSSCFDVKSLGKLSTFISWEIAQGPSGRSICNSDIFEIYCPSTE